MIFRKGELFNGPGGFALGASLAKVEVNGTVYGVKHQWSNDYCDSACDTYTANICPDQPESVHRGDVRKFDLTSFGDIDAFIYGFPCNDFSVVGEKRGLTATMVLYIPTEFKYLNITVLNGSLLKM